MSTTIKLRRDTAANWAAVNPILAAGEIGIETDTLKLKIGDGATAWAALAYGPLIPNEALAAGIDGAKLSAGTVLGEAFAADVRPACRAMSSVDVAIGNGAWAAIPFNGEWYDTDGMHEGVVNPSRLTCKTAGYYLIWGLANFAMSAGGTYRLAKVLVNGAIQISDAPNGGPIGAAIDARVSVPGTVYYLGVGDYVEMLVIQDSGGALNVRAYPRYSPEFGMVRVG